MEAQKKGVGERRPDGGKPHPYGGLSREFPATIMAFYLEYRERPDAHGLIAARRGDTGAIGGPGERKDPALVSALGVERAAVAGVPDAHDLIFARRGDMCAVGGPRHGIDNVQVRAIREHRSPALHVPDAHNPVPGAGSDARAVGRPRHRRCPTLMTAIDYLLR